MIAIIVLLAFVGFLAYKSLRLHGIALVGLNCMFVVEQWVRSQSLFFVERGTLINLLFVAVTIVALAAKSYRGKLFSDPYPLAGYLAIALFSYALLSTMWTPDAVDIELLWNRTAPYIILQILIAPFLISNAKELERVFKYQVIFGGLFLTLVLLGTEFAGRRIVIEGATSTGTNPLAVAQLGGITVICAVMGRLNFRGDVILRLAISAICLIAIVRSGSRGQLVGLGATLIIVYPFAYSIKNPKVFAGTAVAILIFAYVVAVGLENYWADSFRWSSAGMSQDYSGRIEYSIELLHAWINEPGAVLFGLGNSASTWSGLNGSYPHMVPIEILGEEGLIGATLFIWMAVLAGRESMFALRRRHRAPEDRAAFAMLIGMIVYLFLISLKQGNLLGTSQLFMSMILASKLAQVARRDDRNIALATDKQEKTRPGLRRPRLKVPSTARRAYGD